MRCMTRCTCDCSGGPLGSTRAGFGGAACTGKPAYVQNFQRGCLCHTSQLWETSARTRGMCLLVKAANKRPRFVTLSCMLVIRYDM